MMRLVAGGSDGLPAATVERGPARQMFAYKPFWLDRSAGAVPRQARLPALPATTGPDRSDPSRAICHVRPLAHDI